jgi:hypothetical protein
MISTLGHHHHTHTQNPVCVCVCGKDMWFSSKETSFEMLQKKVSCNLYHVNVTEDFMFHVFLSILIHCDECLAQQPSVCHSLVDCENMNTCDLDTKA